jgi:cobalt transporter subunit CbtB
MNRNVSISIPAQGSISVRVAANLPALIVFFFGLVTLYCVGFSTSSIAHNAAHDTRHSSGFPCH